MIEIYRRKTNGIKAGAVRVKFDNFGVPNYWNEIFEFLHSSERFKSYLFTGRILIIKTKDGEFKVGNNFWIVKFSNGVVFPFSSDSFEKEFERDVKKTRMEVIVG